MRFNLDAASEAYAELAPIVLPEGRSLGTNPAETLIDYLVELSKNVLLPQRLRDLDIPENAIGQLASDAMLQTRLLMNNPREVNEDDARIIYQSAW